MSKLKPLGGVSSIFSFVIDDDAVHSQSDVYEFELEPWKASKRLGPISLQRVLACNLPVGSSTTFTMNGEENSMSPV